jgi:hypothetical protein
MDHVRQASQKKDSPKKRQSHPHESYCDFTRAYRIYEEVMPGIKNSGILRYKMAL